MMKVFFVCSGNDGISPIVKSQANSLEKTELGIEVQFFPIIGKGIRGYFTNILPLMRTIKQFQPDLIHAHYSFCGIVSSIATRKPVITSLMGSDVKSSGLWRFLIRFFILHLWHTTIVKSDDMKSSLGIKKVHVIPNGVDIDLFKPIPKDGCRKRIGWDLDKKIVLFAADVKRPEKNYSLAKEAMNLLKLKNFELKVVYGIEHSEMPYFLNASDILLLTSLWEGSPNVVKEAMACNLPILSTDVGDVSWLLGDIEGHYLLKDCPSEMADKIISATQFDKRTKGRERLKELDLGSKTVAQKIINVYKIV